MPILMTILGVIVVASVWWWRLKMMRGAASDALNAAGKLKGAYKRRKFRKAASMSPLEAIDEPVIAAGTLIAAVAGEGIPLANKEKQVITDVLLSISSDHKQAEEAAIYGIWAAESIDNGSIVITKLCSKLRTQLNLQEKETLISLVDEARTAMLANLPVYVEPSNYEYSFKKLKQRIGLEI